MTEMEYVLKEVREAREGSEQALCYGSVDTMEKMYTLKGSIRALREIEQLIEEFERRKRED